MCVNMFLARLGQCPSGWWQQVLCLQDPFQHAFYRGSCCFKSGQLLSHVTAQLEAVITW